MIGQRVEGDQFEPAGCRYPRVGISIITASRIIDICQQRGLGGACLTLGKQDLSFTFAELAGAMAQRGLLAFDGKNASVNPTQKAVVDEFAANGRMLSRKPDPARAGHLSDEFFSALSGSEAYVASISVNSKARTFFST